MQQTPAPGSAVRRFAGDILGFTLRVPAEWRGHAFVRTNIGQARTARAERIAAAQTGRTPLAMDWRDLPMEDQGGGVFAARLPLTAPGLFAAKAFFLPEGAGEPVWPEGADVRVKVAPAACAGRNAIYTAFPRQFLSLDSKVQSTEFRAQSSKFKVQSSEMEARGYAVVPPSGTFRAVARQLDHILGPKGMGFGIVQLLPVHPTPTVYAKMGRYGSPFAALDFFDVDPALAEFDPAATPMDQFQELLDAVHAHGARLFLDLPANHTGWASAAMERHPEWFRREADGTFHSPGAWGVVWEDLVELDHRRPGVREFLAEVFEFWCEKGVDGFRCDAGYMIPAEVWSHVVDRVRSRFPDTVFFLEGLGGSVETTRTLLDTAGLDWAYSELFQTEDRSAFERYLPGAQRLSDEAGPLVHFAETHDNLRLAARSGAWARMRVRLAALLSPEGAWGITNGVEWLATEKVDVHGAADLNWGAEPNLVEDIRRLNALLAQEPAFGPGSRVEMVQQGPGNSLAVLRMVERSNGRTVERSYSPPPISSSRQTVGPSDRQTVGPSDRQTVRQSDRQTVGPSDRQTVGPSDRQTILVLVNLDAEHAQPVQWPAARFDVAEPVDLLGGGKVRPERIDGGLARLALEPGQVLCVAARGAGRQFAVSSSQFAVCSSQFQFVPHCVRAMALAAREALAGGPMRRDEDADALASAFAADPWAALAALSGADAPPRVTEIRLPEDFRRVAPVPPGHVLLVRGKSPFRVGGADAAVPRVEAVRLENGDYVAVAGPLPAAADSAEWTLPVRPGIGEADGLDGALRILALGTAEPMVRRSFSGDEIRRDPERTVLLTNGRGAMAHVRAAWPAVASRYDALLAANPDPRVPCDRWMLLTRCRLWLRVLGFSQPLDASCLERLDAAPDAACWVFRAPVGGGETMRVAVELRMPQGRNAVALTIRLLDGAGRRDSAVPVLIVRPDVDSRSFHEVTKAYAGAEREWPRACEPAPDGAGIVFSPAGRPGLTLRASVGAYVIEPEWTYCVGLPFDAGRGMDGQCDLFSPGYFRIPLSGGAATLVASASGQDLGSQEPLGSPDLAPQPLPVALGEALRAYVVARDDVRTVIAGYPWFLDWGRDTFIVLRGMIAAGMLDESVAIVRAFARFERDGTLPNMIRGNDDSNRDTSDAPLWFSVAVRDLVYNFNRGIRGTRGKTSELNHSRRGASEGLCERLGRERTLALDCGGRSLADVLEGIAGGYRHGTPNGIAMDPATGLVFSPAHYTWMDTNHPAGTPRRGYPVEIQALWISALRFLDEVRPGGDWGALAKRAAESVRRLFWLPAQGYFCDCLHADAPGAKAVADDALRPNQLLLFTLGALEGRGADAEKLRSVLRACAALLVPGAIRTLADAPVAVPQPVERDGRLLNDPLRPYWGRYEGDEDTRRKPAYHNGTAWTWPFPSYAEALAMAWGEAAVPEARALLSSGAGLVEGGAIGHLPEILDGDAPHGQRGCDAQAWGVSEYVRVLRLLDGATR